MLLGAIVILLVLEATRRTAGWVLPITATCFILYTFYGPLLDLVGLGMIAHRGYDLSRIVGTIYMTLEGRLRRAARRRRQLHHPVLDLRRGAWRVGRRQVLPRVVDGGGRHVGRRRRTWTRGHGGRAAARHGVGERRREHGDARLGRVADAQARRLQARHGRARSSPPPASARSSARRRSALRRSSSRSSCTSRTSR